MPLAAADPTRLTLLTKDDHEHREHGGNGEPKDEGVLHVPAGSARSATRCSGSERRDGRPYMSTAANSESTWYAAMYVGLKQRTTASLVRLHTGVWSTSAAAGRRKAAYASLESRSRPRSSTTARDSLELLAPCHARLLAPSDALLDGISISECALITATRMPAIMAAQSMFIR
jgi:hypothetical protein